MTPQIIIIIIYAISLGINISNHGKEQKPKNAWADFIALIIFVTLLWWGGFWDCFVK